MSQFIEEFECEGDYYLMCDKGEIYPFGPYAPVAHRYRDPTQYCCLADPSKKSIEKRIRRITWTSMDWSCSVYTPSPTIQPSKGWQLDEAKEDIMDITRGMF